MKVSRKVGLVLGVVIIVAALVSLYVIYSPQAGEVNDLNTRLSRAQASVPVLTAQKQNLEDQLTSAQSLLEASQVEFPESVESIEYGEYLYEIADECNVNLDSLNFPRPADRTVGAVTYSVVSLSLPISGSLDNIFTFIDTIRNDERFASTDVKSVDIVAAGSKATVKIDIYGYKG